MFAIFQVRAELPDKSPAAGVLVELCAADLCYNLTTAEDGVITTLLSSPGNKRVMVSNNYERDVLSLS